MKSDKYMGMDVHQAMTVVAVLNADGKVILETMVPTEAAAIIRLVQNLSAPLRVTFEETTQAEWLYEVVRAYVTEVIVAIHAATSCWGRDRRPIRWMHGNWQIFSGPGCCARCITDMKQPGS